MKYIDYILNELLDKHIKIGGSYYLHKLGLIPIEDVDDIDIYIFNDTMHKDISSKLSSFLNKYGFKKCLDTIEKRIDGRYYHIPGDILMKCIHIHEVYKARFMNSTDIENIYRSKVWRNNNRLYSKYEIDSGKPERELRQINLMKEYFENNNYIVCDVNMFRDRIRGMIYGGIIGDMLGVPYEFERPESLKNDPFTGEYVIGGHHDQPKYSWSDDTSMVLAMMDSLDSNLFEWHAYDNIDTARRYLKWYKEAKYTSNNVVFDYGIGTRNGLSRFEILQNENPDKDAVMFLDNILLESKGNGALMRIHPLVGLKDNRILKNVTENVRLTHDNDFSVQIAMVYMHILYGLKMGEDIKTSYEKAVKRFDLIEETLPTSIDELKLMEPTGYAFNTLINVVYSVYHNKTFKDTMLMIINLGGDTDTNASIAGVMAGLIYGHSGIEQELLEPFRIEGSSHHKLINTIGSFAEMASSYDHRMSVEGINF